MVGRDTANLGAGCGCIINGNIVAIAVRDLFGMPLINRRDSGTGTKGLCHFINRAIGETCPVNVSSCRLPSGSSRTGLSAMVSRFMLTQGRLSRALRMRPKWIVHPQPAVVFGAVALAGSTLLLL